MDEIVVEDKTATIKGSYAALAKTMQQIKTGNLNNQVPGFMPDWRARSETVGLISVALYLSVCRNQAVLLHGP